MDDSDPNPNLISNLNSLRNAQYYVLPHGQSQAVPNDPEASTRSFGLTLGRQQAHQAGQKIEREIKRHQFSGMVMIVFRSWRAKETAEIAYEEVMPFPGGQHRDKAYPSSISHASLH
jgi:hypothetical protein